MGISAIMILLCHAPGNNVLMPNYFAKILSYGNIGVDIFLLLSGIGIYYSLSDRKVSYLKWYLRRFIRVLIPYWILISPYLIIKFSIDNMPFTECMWNLFALSYWINGHGTWFVSLIILLYILTPPHILLN